MPDPVVPLKRILTVVLTAMQDAGIDVAAHKATLVSTLNKSFEQLAREGTLGEYLDGFALEDDLPDEDGEDEEDDDGPADFLDMADEWTIILAEEYIRLVSDMLTEKDMRLLADYAGGSDTKPPKHLVKLKLVMYDEEEGDFSLTPLGDMVLEGEPPVRSGDSEDPEDFGDETDEAGEASEADMADMADEADTAVEA